MSDFEDKLMELKKRIENGETEVEPAKEAAVVEEAAPEVSEVEPEAAEPEVKDPDAVTEPAKEEVVDEKKAKVSAYEERKAKKASKQVEMLQAEVAAERAARLAIEATMKQFQPQQQEKQAEYEADPDAALDRKLNTALSELESFKRERLVTDAVNEFQGHVKALEEELPDIEKVIDAGFSTLCQSIALMNPGANKAEIEKQAKISVLRIASTAMNKGENPAEAVYEHFTRNGIKAAQVEAKAEKPSEAKKLEAVVKNKAKSGTPLSGGGASSSVNLSKESFMKMTPAQYWSLTPEERTRIMN